MLKSSDTISFWRDEDIVDVGCPLHFIVPNNSNPRGKWPGKVPSLSTILRELELSRMSYITLKIAPQKIFINILTGRYLVKGTIVEDRSGKQFKLNFSNAIEYATNKQRGTMIATGKRVKHKGLICKDNLRNVSTHTAAILNKIDLGKDQEESVSSQKEEALDFNEVNLLETLDQYIESEFEVEQQIAQSTQPFSYFNLRPEARRVVYRQFYRIDVDPDDLARMREMKVSLVTIETSDEEGLAVEIVDLSPAQEKNEIIVSLERQVPANAIPKSGLLRLDAMPTLKNVRKSVVEQLRQKKSANKWLAPVASGTYRYNRLTPEKIELPPSKFPPNPSQVDALDKGAGTEDYLLVLGPPGTGKTTVILNWVNHFVKQGKRVLITSQSNMAVDNVLERLVDNDGVQCVRLGNETKVSSAIRKILIDNYATNIQSHLIEKISEVQEHLIEDAKGLNGFKEKIPQIKVFKDEHKRFSKERSANEKNISASEKLLKAVHDHLNKQIEKLKKAEAAKQKREQIYNRRKEAKGFFSFISKTLASFDSSKLTRLEKEITRVNAAIGKYETEKAQFEGTLKTQQGQNDQVLEQLSHVEHSFRKYVEVSEPLVPELSVIPHDGLEEFNEKLVLKGIKQRDTQYQELQEIVGEWQQVFTGERQKSVYQLLLSMVDVVGATCIGINTNRSFKDIPFDVVIVDESGQIQLHNLIVPLSRGPKAILVGDHKQLPPVVQDEVKQELANREVDDTLLGKSWFEELWAQAPEDRKSMMDTQFRCPSLISDFVSKAFYEGKYKAGPGTGPDDKKPIFSFFKQSMVFIDTSGYDESKRREKSSRQEGRTVVEGNRLETRLVLEVLEKALAERPELGLNNEIGIIVPYANHVKEIIQAIRREKKQRFNTLNMPLNELVASVDSFQGQERDLIIMAFSRSNRYGNVGFLCDWRRLNVAMTRTKKQLVLIGDMSTLKKIDRRKGSSANDYEFKTAMESLETFIKKQGHFIDATHWEKNAQSSSDPSISGVSDNAKQGEFEHV